MEDLIMQVRKYYKYFNLPSNPAQIDGWHYYLREPSIVIRSPRKLDLRPEFDDLIAIYRDHNGMPIGDSHQLLPVRLMSYEESHNLNAQIRMLEFSDPGWIELENDQYLLWSDDNGDYMGIYLAEPLTGKIFFLDHEEPDYAPRFRSVRTFYEALINAAKCNAVKSEDEYFIYYKDLATDYPKSRADPLHDDSDMNAASTYVNLYQAESDNRKRFRYASIAMNLLPIYHRDALVMFADDTRNPWIQERAIRIFGLRRDKQAIEQITRIVHTSKHGNPQIAGELALQKITYNEEK